MNCICCNKQIMGDVNEDSADPICICDSDFLEVVICDECIRERSQHIMRIRTAKTTWRGDRHEFLSDEE